VASDFDNLLHKALNSIKTELKIDLPPLPPNTNFALGIKQGKRLRNSNHKSVLQRRGYEANPYAAGYYRNLTEADSFKSVWQANLQSFFEVQYENDQDYIFNQFLLGKDENIKKELKKLMRTSYVNMSKRLRNRPHRAAIKGFNAYAIGTGQTLEAIKVWQEKA
jgi:hypothetical protein